MNASSKTLMRIPQIEWSGELLSVSFRLFRVSSHLPCLFELAKCIFFEQLVWKEKKENKKHTNSIARIRARASRPAVSFAYLKVHHAAKNTKYKTRSISECYVRNNHATHRL